MTVLSRLRRPTDAKTVSTPGKAVWAQIEEQTLTAAASSVTFDSRIEGDKDQIYKFVYRVVPVIGTTPFYVLRLNSDATAANYTRQVLTGTGAAAAATRDSTPTGLYVGEEDVASGSEIVTGGSTLFAESGKVRTCSGWATAGVTTGSPSVVNTIHFTSMWVNTTDEITSIIFAETGGASKLGVGSRFELWAKALV